MARIKIDVDRRLGTVDRRIFGGFIEHLGRCIYGGILEEGSSLSDARGFRRDVLAAARGLQVPVLRWPGGNFVSGYHWQDGVGPVEQRPRRLELAWRTEESNRFGTDEFIAYCRELGAEPYICVNMGTGSQDEAQAWVEYCNGTGNTYWANLRRANGHPEPHAVKYWGLGNEMYGAWQIGRLSAEDYLKKAIEFAKVMHWTDPTIQLVSCGENGWSDWDRVVLEGLAPHVAFHSIHLYTGSDDYYRNVMAPHQAERALHLCRALIDRVRFTRHIKHEIHVAYDEWNVWFQSRRQQPALEQRYTLADALAVATFLNIFIRQCRTVRMANLAQMVNVIAPIFTSPDGMFLQTIYHPLRLYAEETHEIALDPYVECDTFTFPSDGANAPAPPQVADLGPFALLDVAATCDREGHNLTVTVVNRAPDRAIPATIQLTDAVAERGIAVRTVSGAGPDAANSFAHPDTVGVSDQHLELGGATFDYAYPAHSVTVLRLRTG
jgi:alpha-L-arabinofuranosidase